ncbi:aminoglycoside phosphotransferase family protein [Sphingoaurantiacus capsulatus]|uniref:Aminoglycoside phosphotransferase family protein n=1 Tax=Sphingoaurantiacus capsulatus TaxID=1771310 RepID=A0ABV7X6G7_9SPHN
MVPPASAPDFLAANGWGGAAIVPLAGDASFRRYFRVVGDRGQAVLMDAPPDKEDSRPFLDIAAHLVSLGFAAPRALAVDLDQGLILLEDFGDKRVAPLLAGDPTDETAIYEAAIDILAALHDHAPPPVAPYARGELLREVNILTEWYLPIVGAAGDAAAYDAAWDAVWGDVISETAAQPVLVLRDYHADNLMVLDDRDGLQRLGLLDFQDGLAGHPAYDLVSLLQDARRDVSPRLESAMLDRYMDARGIADREGFRASYEVLGAQRNAKILGVFSRLWKRDGKPGYRQFQPRVWGYLERNLRHPALAPVKAWFDANLADDQRAPAWKDAQ